MASINKIISSSARSNYYLGAKVAADQQQLATAIANLEKRIIKETSQLKVSKGASLVGPRVNLKQAQKIHGDLSKMFNETYGAAARKVTNGYAQTANSIKDSWGDLDIAVNYTAVDVDMMSTLKKQYYKEFAKFGKDAEEKIAKAMYDNVAGQQPYNELVNSISAALTGKYDKRGNSMSNHANLFANDGTMNFHQAVTLKKGNDAGLEHFLYVGNVMNTSRDFCIKRVGQVYSREEINSWNFKWTGRAGPALTHRGGYNCRHHWQPVKPSWIKNGGREELELRTAASNETYFLAMNEMAQYGVKPGSKGAMFVEALIEQPMTNAGIKGMPWNTTGNLHGDIFKKLKNKGLAGVGKDGKKWIKGPSAQVMDIVDDDLVKGASSAEKALKGVDDAKSAWKVEGQIYSKLDEYDYDVFDIALEGGAKIEAATDATIEISKLQGTGIVQVNDIKGVIKLHADPKLSKHIKLPQVLKFDGEYFIEEGQDIVEANWWLGKKKIKVALKDIDKYTKFADEGTLTTLDEVLSEIDKLDDTAIAAVEAKAKAKLAGKAKAAITSTSEQLGMKAGTAKAKFVDALTEQPMTNAEIKALNWNPKGNLHGDVFKDLQSKGYAGIANGKKWVSLTGEAPAALLEAPSVAMAQAAPALKPGKIVKHFDDIKFRGGILKADADELMELSNSHLSLMHQQHNQLDGLLKGRPRLGGLRLDTGDALQGGKGKIGMYDAGNRTISLASDLPRTHNLRVGGYYNVGTDYYSALRHEYGHHVWKQNTSVRDAFEEFYTSLLEGDADYFGKKLSQYATGSIDDAFAEAFSAFTSPLHKTTAARKLPKELEAFFDHWLDGKSAASYKKYIKLPESTEVVKSGVLFADKKNQQAYSVYKDRYTKRIKMSAKSVNETAKDLYHEELHGTWMQRGMDSWQGSTSGDRAMLVKLKAEILESRRLTTRIKRGTSARFADLWQRANAASDEAYIKARALTAAYYDAKGVKKVKLWRGIGGHNGGAYRQAMLDAKASTPTSQWRSTNVLIKEDSLVGYSSSKSTADRFGSVYVERDMDVRDIIMGHDNWGKTGYFSEKEFIVIGGNYNVPLSKMF